MKTYLCLLLAGILAALPMTIQSRTVETRQITITLPTFGQPIELPDSIPQDIQRQIRVIIASMPQDELLTWSEIIVCIVIVVVVGVILYCLWRCSQMIPPPQPQPAPDDPAFADMPHMLVYNMTPAAECELQYCTSFPQKGNSIEWVTICNLSEITDDIIFQVPESDKMFFKLESKQ